MSNMGLHGGEAYNFHQSKADSSMPREEGGKRFLEPGVLGMAWSDV